MSGRPNRGYFPARRRSPGSYSAGQAFGGAGSAGGRPAVSGAGLLPSGWRDRAYLALDFETTGLDPRRERVVEIGALRFRLAKPGCDADAGPLFAAACEDRAAYGADGAAGAPAGLAEEGTLSVLVDPGMPIPPVTTGIHGIRDEDVRGEPDFAARAPALAELARGAVIIAHNAPFDLAFLRAELERAGMPAALNEVLDTRILAKAAYPGLQSYKLVDLARFLGIDTGRSHRALDDAKTCAALFLAAARRLEGEPEAAAEA